MCAPMPQSAGRVAAPPLQTLKPFCTGVAFTSVLLGRSQEKTRIPNKALESMDFSCTGDGLGPHCCLFSIWVWLYLIHIPRETPHELFLVEEI